MLYFDISLPTSEPLSWLAEYILYGSPTTDRDGIKRTRTRRKDNNLLI
jgi:hypothetical protein